MGASENFTGQNIQDTYQRVLQVGSGGQVFDGTGSLAPILHMTASYALSASVEITHEVSSSHAQRADFADAGNFISASSQIATEISGAFFATSASFSTRVTLNDAKETNVDQDLSALALKTQISGSFVEASASFSTRVSTNDAKVSYTDAAVTSVIHTANILSSSAQIATEISGAFFATSASFSTRVSLNDAKETNVDQDLSALALKTQISGSFVELSASLGGRTADSERNIISLTTTSGSLLSSIDMLSIVTGSYAVTGSDVSFADIAGNNIAAADVLSTSFTGSVDNPAIRLGPLSGNLSGNKVGIMLEDAAPDNKLFVPYFVSDGSKVFGFGTNMEMHKSIQMNEYKISFDGDAANTFIHADSATPENLEIHADGNLELRAQDDLQVYSDIDITGRISTTSHITASGDISASGDIYGDKFTSNDHNVANFDGDSINFGYENSTAIQIGKSGNPTTFYGSITASGVLGGGHISASANVYAKDYFDDGVNINTLYAQVTGSDDNYVTDAEKTVIGNTSNTNTGDETTATVNALNITEVGALADGTIASGFGNIDNGTSTIDTGEITATSIKHSISGNNAGDYGPGAEILYGISSTSVTAGAIYTLRSGVWTLIDANFDNRVYNLCAVATIAAGNGNSGDGMIIKGCVTLASAYTAGSDAAGIPVYASETGGEATLTAPSDSGDLVRILGYSLNVSSKKMFFNPDSTYVEIA